MNNLKFFTLTSAIGLSLTATYATKAHRAYQIIGVENALATYNSNGSITFIAVNPADIGNDFNFVCQADPDNYCQLFYTGTYSFFSGTEITLPAGDWGYSGQPFERLVNND